MNDQESLLSVSNLGVEFDQNYILKNLNFDLKRGETLVIAGPNGVGKTVLLKALLGLIPYSGLIDWRKNTAIGYIPQRVPLNQDLPLTVEDFFQMRGVDSMSTIQKIKEVGINEQNFIKKRLGILSSGQFQRVLLAWAMSNSPQVLIFDEPISGIDFVGEETINHLMKETQREKDLSLIVVTHDLNKVYNQTNHVLCLNRDIACYGTPHEVLTPETLQTLYGGEHRHYRHIQH
jgi:zinc transport system ATP-binding protein